MPPVCAAGGASRAGGRSASFRPRAFPGQATKRVSLASLWSWGAWPPYRCGLCSPAFCGRDLCGVLARWRGLASSPWFLWELAAGAGGRAVLRLLSRAGGGGTIPPASGGWGPAPPRLAVRWGGWGGGGVAPRPPCSPSGGRPVVPYPGPPLVVHALPPGVRVRSGSRGRPGGGGGEGRPVDRSPGGPFKPEPSLCPPRVGCGHGGGHRGRGPHTVLVRRRVPPPGLVRALLWRAGVGSPVGRDPRGSRRLGALGRAVCRSSRIPPPPRRGPFWGRGGFPSAPGGRRVAPVALKLGGGAGGGGGWGAAPPPPAPPAPSGVGLPSVVSGEPPRGILVPWGLPGGHGRRARPGQPPMGQCGGGGEGGGGEPPRPGSRPRLPLGRPLKGLLCLRRPGRRRSAVGRQRAGRERAGGSPGALAAAAVPPHPGCSGLFGGGAGPPSLWSASVRSWA